MQCSFNVYPGRRYAAAFSVAPCGMSHIDPI